MTNQTIVKIFLFGIIIFTLLFLAGCATDVQMYKSTKDLPKPVERIGPGVEIEKPVEQKEKEYVLPFPKQKIPLPNRETFEITQKDLFSEDDWNPEKVSVFNISLGDSLELVLSNIGKPDDVVPHQAENIVNIGYSKILGSEKTALSLYFHNDTLDRITVTESFNKYLHGATVINYTKTEIYSKFGLPDEQKDTPQFRVFKYAKGFEILHSGNKMKAFIITYPHPEIKSEAKSKAITSAVQDSAN